MRLLLLVLLAFTAGAALEPEEADPVVLRRVAALRCPAPSYALAELLDWQRRSYAGAVVTSGFFDSRGVSRYRSQPGLHLGYDVAMPAGSPVLAAWSGKVTAVVPWADGEWGVTVEHHDASRATYGHIVPGVKPGTLVTPGMSLGSVAVDHLDVKMRNARGEPLDYGVSSSPSRERLLADWWLARLAERDAEEGRRRAGQRRAQLERRAARRAEVQELGLWTPRQVHQFEVELRKASAGSRAPALGGRSQARRDGLHWNEVRKLASRWGALHPELRRPARTLPAVTRPPLGSWK